MESKLESKPARKSGEPLKNDVMQGNEELPTEPYHLVRRVGGDEVDEAEHVFQAHAKNGLKKD